MTDELLGATVSEVDGGGHTRGRRAVLRVLVKSFELLNGNDWVNLTVGVVPVAAVTWLVFHPDAITPEQWWDGQLLGCVSTLAALTFAGVWRALDCGHDETFH